MPPTTDWNPAQYDRYRAERRQPFFDLLALVQARPGMRVADLGCGTGELTQILHRRLDARETLGIDSSPAMLEKAAGLATPGLRFELSDLQNLGGHGRFDLVFSNAALHWVAGHERLLERLVSTLAAGGQLAVQVPANHDHPSHTVAREVIAEPPFRDAASGAPRVRPILAPEEYAALLHRLGFVEQHVRLQVYGHLLAARDDVIEWVKGTLLIEYERLLPAPLFAEFVPRYRERLLARLPDTRPFFYPFQRLLFWGRRSGELPPASPQ